MWTTLCACWRWVLGRFKAPKHAYKLFLSDSRYTAQEAARSGEVVAIFNDSGKPKWAYFMCPCGCGQQLALNLMPTQLPHWRVSILSDTDFSVLPSVDSTTCGAHFWLRNGRITWCE